MKSFPAVKPNPTLIGLIFSCLLLGAPVPVEATAPDPVQAAADEALERIKRLDRSGCANAVDRVADHALQGWTASSLSWLRARAACVPTAFFEAGRETPIQTLLERFSPWLALADSAPQPSEGSVAVAMQLRMHLWNAMESNRGSAQAEGLERAYVMSLIARVQQQAGDALAQVALRQWAQGQYGNAARQGRMRHWAEVLGTELGAGHPLQLRMLAALAFSYRLVGRPQPALDAAQRLHDLVQRHHAGDGRWRMSAASEYGLALSGNGRLAEAMDQLRVWQELESHQVPPRWDNQMRLHYNLSALAFGLGDDDAAVHHADESVRLSRLIGDERNATESLAGELTKAQAKLRRDDADAVTYLRDVVARVETIGLGAGSAVYALSRHAEQVGNTDLLAWSHDVLQRYAGLRWDALHGQRPMLPLAAARLHAAGSAARQRQLEQAAAIGLAGSSGSLEAQAWFALADERATAQPDQAIWLYKHGANVLQGLRQGLSADDPGAQRLWLADHEQPLRRLVGLLIDRGRLVEAQQALRVLRDEELHEYQRRSRGVRRSSRAAPVMLTAPERALDAAVQPLAARVRAEVPAADGRADGEQDFRVRVSRGDQQVQAMLDEVAGGLRQLLGRPVAADDRPAERADPTLATALPPGVGRVLYFVRDASLDIAVQRGRRWTRVSVPVSRVELARQVHALRVAVTTPQGDVRAAAAQLYRWLLAPVRHQLQDLAHLQLVPDGVLRLLPFAALHDGVRWAGERWALQIDDGVPASAPTVPPRHAAHVLALGRTVGDRDHAPLPAVRDELAVLSASGPGVRALADGDFSALALADGLAGSPSVVHLASHFVLDGTHEEGAYLLLGDGERMPLSRLRALPWQGVQLAVLSACDTGVPDPTASGRQAGGLAAALQQAGAANVLATLWPVTDGSTALWMRSFYRPWRSKGAHRALPRADWVARTQRDWLRRHAGTPLAHPHHWAGFVWMAGP